MPIRSRMVVRIDGLVTTPIAFLSCWPRPSSGCVAVVRGCSTFLSPNDRGTSPGFNLYQGCFVHLRRFVLDVDGLSDLAGMSKAARPRVVAATMVCSWTARA